MIYKKIIKYTHNVLIIQIKLDQGNVCNKIFRRISININQLYVFLEEALIEFYNIYNLLYAYFSLK